MALLYSMLRNHELLAMIERAHELRSTKLNLSSYEIQELPPSVSNLQCLEKLLLKRNCLKMMPQDLSKLQQLKWLAVDYNQLVQFPQSICFLINLKSLNLSYNNIEVIPSEIKFLYNLETLWLNNANIHCLPSEIGELINLETFGARKNFIFELPIEIQNLKRLRWLTLECNRLASVHHEIELPELIHLNLGQNKLRLLPVLGNYKMLEFVCLSNNQIQEIDIDQISKLSFIKKIDLKDNPVLNNANMMMELKKLPNICVDDNFVLQDDNDHVNNDSDSLEDWEESIPSSDIDSSSDQSDDNVDVDEFVDKTLPGIARFVSSGM